MQDHRELLAAGQVETRLARQPFAYPTRQIKRRPDAIFGHPHHEPIKAPMAV